MSCGSVSAYEYICEHTFLILPRIYICLSYVWVYDYMMQRASPHGAQRTATQGQMPSPRHKKRWDKAGRRQPETHSGFSRSFITYNLSLYYIPIHSIHFDFLRCGRTQKSVFFGAGGGTNPKLNSMARGTPILYGSMGCASLVESGL